MDNKIIVHVSEVNISTNSGMGRVEYYWRNAFENAGYTFIHIGPNEVGPVKMAAFFPYKAYKYFKSLKIKPAAIIVHEPQSGFFVRAGIPCFVESHGVERRYWEDRINGRAPSSDTNNIQLRTRIFFPIWRLLSCDIGLKYGTKLLLINSDDKAYVKVKYKRKDEDIHVFKNGIKLLDLPETKKMPETFRILFNGTWIERKGVKTLVDAAKILFKQGLKINYMLIGTGKDEETVLSAWPNELKPFVTVVSNFAPEDEAEYLNNSSLFVLPSYAEGQPLSLLQAMAASMCCITTNCCGQKDTIIDKKTGFLFPIGDHAALAALITNCYYNPQIIQKVGCSAKEYITDYTWEKVSADVVDYVTHNLK